MPNQGALANLDEEAVLARIAAGQHVKPIAAEFGVSHQALYQRLAKNPKYQITREIGTDVRLADLEKQIAEIPDDAPPLALARARELLSHARWRAEREFPHRWGQKAHVSGDLSITVQINRGVVLEGEKPLRISEGTESASEIMFEDGDVTR